MSEEKKGWYVLRAISGKENKVKEVLDAEIKNTDLGNYVFQVLIPTEKVYTVRNGKKVVKEKNLYSGYVFVEAILVGEVVHHLRNTTNVIDFLGGKSNQPEPLRPSEVNRMLGAVDEMQEVGDEPSVLLPVDLMELQNTVNRITREFEFLHRLLDGVVFRLALLFGTLREVEVEL